jgi:hypothetical protein
MLLASGDTATRGVALSGMVASANLTTVAQELARPPPQPPTVTQLAIGGFVLSTCFLLAWLDAYAQATDTLTRSDEGEGGAAADAAAGVMSAGFGGSGLLGSGLLGSVLRFVLRSLELLSDIVTELIFKAAFLLGAVVVCMYAVDTMVVAPMSMPMDGTVPGPPPPGTPAASSMGMGTFFAWLNEPRILGAAGVALVVAVLYGTIFVPKTTDPVAAARAARRIYYCMLVSFLLFVWAQIAVIAWWRA